MPIVNVYQNFAKGGFRKRRRVTRDITGIIRQSEILLASKSDEFGNKTIEGYRAANDLLSPFRGEPRVELAFLNNENNSSQLSDNIFQAQTDVDLFESDLEDSLDDVAFENKNDPLGLIKATSNVYLDAANLFQSDTMDLVNSRLASGQNVPASVFNFRDELEDRNEQMALAANAFSIPDEEGNIGVDVPDAYTFLIQTNPATGKISSIRFHPITPDSPLPKGYNRTDSFLGETGISVSLLTVKEGDKITARLGDRFFKLKRGLIESEEDFATSILKQDVGPHFFGIGAGERKIEIGDVTFDAFDIPINTLLRHGSRKFSYLDKDNILHAVGAENLPALKDFINSSGGNAENVFSREFRVTSNYLKEKSSFEIGDPIVAPERISTDLGGGSLAVPVTGAGVAVPEAGGESRFQPRGSLEGETPTEIPASGVSGRIGGDFSKVHEESRQKIAATAKSFFERAKQSTFLR